MRCRELPAGAGPLQHRERSHFPPLRRPLLQDGNVPTVGISFQPFQGGYHEMRGQVSVGLDRIGLQCGPRLDVAWLELASERADIAPESLLHTPPVRSTIDLVLP